MEPQATPSERLVPSLSPDLEHKVDEPEPQIVGPPAFASPDPATLSGALVPVEVHPLADQLSEDFGETARAGFSDVDAPQGTLTVDITPSGPKGTAPEDRAEWTKAHWQEAAKGYGLPTSGKKDDLQAAVEKHEAIVNEAKAMTAEEWKEDIADASDADELAEIRSLYSQSGASFSTVDSAFDAKQAEFDGTNDES